MSDAGMIVVLSLAGAILIYCAGIYQGNEAMRLEAVRVGHAEYFTNEQGQRAWRWLPTRKEKHE